jgi:gamma-glutamyl-gamma-aminobutyrate hydrolase PuuD
MSFWVTRSSQRKAERTRKRRRLKEVSMRKEETEVPSFHHQSFFLFAVELVSL